MSKIRLTEAQIKAGERHLTGSGDPKRKAAILWSKVRGRLRGEERWRALVDLSVREVLLAAAENADPYILYELAREATERMAPLLRVRLQRDLHELLEHGAGVGVTWGTSDFPQTVTRPEPARLARLLATREEWNEMTELKPKVEDRLDFSPRKTAALLKTLEGDGAIRRWTETLRSKGRRGRPSKVKKVALIPQGKAYLATFEGPQLGPGAISTHRYKRPVRLDETVAQRVWAPLQSALEEPPARAGRIVFMGAGAERRLLFRWLEGEID